MIATAEMDRLAARVRASARDGGLIETAQVKLLGLDEVRQAAGARWPRMREHVREGSLKIIAARIGADDAVIPCGDGFLVVFADTAAAETERRCSDIRDALISFYLGEEALKAVRADVARETVSAAHLANMVSAPPRADASRAPELKLGRFWPVWSQRRQSVAAYLCAPHLETKDAPPRMGYTPDFLEKAVHGDVDFIDLDLCLLEQAFEAAEHAEGLPIGVTVHATTLQVRRSRTLYLNHLAAHASPAKQRMFVSIAEIAPGTPLLSLTEWTNALKHTFPRVSLELHRNDRALSAIASTGAWAAGYHVSSLKGAPGGQLRTALNEIDAWCRVLRRQGVQPFIHGFAEAGFFDLASFSEIAFATGEALWPCQQTLEQLAAPAKTPPSQHTALAP
jgi:hypothetical protein